MFFNLMLFDFLRFDFIFFDFIFFEFIFFKSFLFQRIHYRIDIFPDHALIGTRGRSGGSHSI